MAGRAGEELASYAQALQRLGWRGLALVHHRSHAHAARAALEALGAEPGECHAIADSGARAALEGLCSRILSPTRYQEILGSEARVALVALGGLVRPNILAATAETVVEGGLLVIAAGPPGEWNPGPPGGLGLYRGYLLDSIRRSRSHIIVDLESGTVYSKAVPREPAPPRPPGPRVARGLPARLARLAATADQLSALEAAARLLRGRGRTLLVLGDRGRGKSFLLGLALALAIHERQAGRVHVVAPSPASASSLYRGLKAGLEALGYGGLYRERLESGYTARLWGPWFSVIHRSPESAEPAPLLVVDEAAAVGVARVRRLSWRSGRVMVASTVHGYEGSGRALVHVLEADLPRPLARVELGEPIRYRRGDPLEEWVLKAFHLDAEPPSVPPEKALGAACRTVPRGRLGPWDAYTSRLLGVLAQAHYRFEPDYILVALESPNHELIALEAPGGEPVAAADVAVEDPSMEEAARLGLKALSTHAPEAGGLRGARIVRIAVSPPLQRMGLGTRILRCAEAHAAKHGALVVTALFSRHDVLGFWVENGYLVAYISPRYNRATGEKNVCVAKPLAPGARGAVEEASSAFRVRLLLSLQSIYRDLAAERVPLILEATAPSHHRPVALTGDMERRLSEFLAGRLDLEQAFDAVWAAAVDCLASRSPSSLGLTQREATALAARILQGKPLNDVAYTLSTTMSEAHATASQAARRLLEACTAPTGAS